MSSSGLIYAVIVGAWAAYLVPMWLRRQDELNEARPTERFSTAIRLLSGRAGMERRYAKDLRARSTDEGEPDADPDAVTDSVDVRAFAMPPHRAHTKAQLPVERGESPQHPKQAQLQPGKPAPQGKAGPQGKPVPQQAAAGTPMTAQSSAGAQGAAGMQGGMQGKAGMQGAARAKSAAAASRSSSPSPSSSSSSPEGKRRAAARKAASAEALARARRTKVLARRRRTTVMLFLAFTLGAVVAAVGGLAFLWAPAVPAVLLSAYIAHLRRQERKRFAYVMDRRRAEVAAQQLRERQPRRRPVTEVVDADEPEDGPENEETRPDLNALAADRRALVEQTDHAEWIDQQRERQRKPGQGESWDPVPVPLPTYVTAPVAPRATSGVDLGAPDAWSSARSSAADPHAGAREVESESTAEEDPADAGPPEAADTPDGGRSDARRAASARRSRERGRTPLFDQYEDGDRPRAANE
ncbi:gephyrin-like molybdotransferase receptor GlpR [Streptomyces ossamyceticus]|uniref:divisome protein SepX/GlpR n=1 Tax=Streptomyces ossamyceticus TaxID=249581 RepID=UPI00341BB7B2